jgi:hypothetical protein
MALSANDLDRLKMMAGEAHKTTRALDDDDLQFIADQYAKIKDADGNAPTASGYTDTYDLYVAAAEAWRMKAGQFAEDFDFEAEGGVFRRSQKYTNALQQSARYAAMAGQMAPQIRSIAVEGAAK